MLFRSCAARCELFLRTMLGRNLRASWRFNLRAVPCTREASPLPLLTWLLSQAGRISTVNGSNSCTDCAKGKYQPLAGASFCTTCTAGCVVVLTLFALTRVGCLQFHRSVNWLIVVHGCTSLRYCLSLISLSACLQCPSGQFSNSSSTTACFGCSLGRWSSYTINAQGVVLGPTSCQVHLALPCLL